MLIPITALAIVIVLRLLAGTDNILGHICRAYWNISFKIVAYIPFMGWMARFIIADTEEEIRRKGDYIEMGKQSDAFAENMVNDAARRRKRDNLRDAILAQLKDGTDVVVNDDDETVRINGVEYTVKEVKNRLNIM